MKHRFNAFSAEEETDIRNAVHQTISCLKDIDEDTGKAKIGFDSTVGLIVANLIDIGVAPDAATISDQMRETVRMHGSVRLAMNASHAQDLARYIEIGLLRHEHGINTPDEFRLH
jgi:hypothetical protein